MFECESHISNTRVQIQTHIQHTIAIDIFFKKNPQNKIFYTYPEKNAEIISYISENKNLYIFSGFHLSC